MWAAVVNDFDSTHAARALLYLAVSVFKLQLILNLKLILKSLFTIRLTD